jgi:hypothetical protein
MFFAISALEYETSFGIEGIGLRLAAQTVLFDESVGVEEKGAVGSLKRTTEN